MKIIRAAHLGMCFGVRDAIALAFKHAEEGPLTVLGELVHNQTVLNSLESKGIKVESQIEGVDTPTAMVTAHGASELALNRARNRGLRVIEATCPLVHFAHHAVGKLVRAGYHPIIIGKRDHVEVRGLTEDLAEYDVVLDDADVERLKDRPRFGIAAQTTQPIERVQRLVALIRQRFPHSEARFADTVCQPTKQRQLAAAELARQCNIVIVIGGANSNNTRELVATCRRFCACVHHVQSASGVNPEWILGAEAVGITAGTSTPDSLIDEIEDRLKTVACDRDVAMA
ncbi:MAG: 4-hydroxy-3-methylbut-2-enyl diphosphate reductase [Verrucomicrobia bacterium]|nr:4-hydroxy-3-methylbut-2-enyl diphosphate reductase [Verrucomicrobiota bacterium]